MAPWSVSLCVSRCVCGTHAGGQVCAVVQISQPEEVCETLSDIKRVQFLIPRIQDVENIDVILIPSAERNVQEEMLQCVISEVISVLLDSVVVCF